MKTELLSSKYRKELSALEEKICDNISGLLLFLKGVHPQVLADQTSYLNIEFDEPALVVGFPDKDAIFAGSFYIIGAALIGKGKSARLYVMAANGFLEDRTLEPTGKLGVNLVALTQVLERLELLARELY